MVEMNLCQDLFSFASYLLHTSSPPETQMSGLTKVKANLSPELLDYP